MYPNQGGYPQQPGGYPPQQQPGGYPPQASMTGMPMQPGAQPQMMQPGAMPGAMPGAVPVVQQMVQPRGQGAIRVQLAGSKLANKDIGGKSDPFYTIHRADTNGKAVGPQIQKSEVINNNLSPVWQPFTTSVKNFCGGEYHQRLRIEVWDHDLGGKSESMGHILVTLRDIMDAHSNGRKFPVHGVKKMGFTSSKPVGEIYIKDFSLWEENLPQ